MGKKETIERKQLKPIIEAYIKECAARMGERSNLQLAIRHDDWGNRINGVWKWSSSEITVGNDKYTIRDRQVTDEHFLAVVENALKESGIRGKIFTEPYWPGTYTKVDRFSRLEIFAPSCQEFNRLNDLLKGLTRKTLADTDIYGVNVCGKRSSYSDSGSYKYLCYNKENCKDIADLITAVCDDKDTLRFTVEEFLDHGDEGDYRAAQYHESEWYGSRGQNLHIIVKDQDGKEKFNDVCTFADCPPVPRELLREKIKVRSDIPESEVRAAEREAVLSVYCRIVDTSARRFTEDQIADIKHYRAMFTKDTPTAELFSRLFDKASQEPDVKRVPEKWSTDTMKELNDLAEGITREQSQGLKR